MHIFIVQTSLKCTFRRSHFVKMYVFFEETNKNSQHSSKSKLEHLVEFYTHTYSMRRGGDVNDNRGKPLP